MTEFEYEPRPDTVGMEKLGCSERATEGLPFMSRVPGHHTANDVILYDAESVCRTGLAAHGSHDAMAQHASKER